VTHRSVFTTPSVGRIGVRLASTRNVTMAEQRQPDGHKPGCPRQPPCCRRCGGSSAAEACVISAMKDYVRCGTLDTCQQSPPYAQAK